MDVMNILLKSDLAKKAISKLIVKGMSSAFLIKKSDIHIFLDDVQMSHQKNCTDINFSANIKLSNDALLKILNKLGD